VGVLCWNTQKNTLNRQFQQRLAGLMACYPTALLLLQEAKLPVGQRLDLEDLSYVVAPNIQTQSHLYGVLTAAKSAFNEVVPLLSTTREMRFATHKSLMMTTHLLPDGQSLLVVNIHAINFVHHSRFLSEIEALVIRLNRHPGPMIVAGDFNVWSKARLNHLARFCESVHLKQAIMENPHYIKRMFRKPLDFIFYRGLTLLSATAIDTDVVSDHNPIYARFLY